jgi:GntR family transcriptional regulator, transcriptional repressor for pyruvate dehydrogenase complex
VLVSALDPPPNPLTEPSDRSDPRRATRSGSTASQIAHEIIDRIRFGAYPVGGRLPSETFFSTEFGVSRPVIREALSAVQFVGYAESSRGAGNFVISAEPTLYADRKVEPSDTATFRHRETFELLEARLLLEPVVVGHAALDPDPMALEMVGKLIDGMKVAIQQPDFDANTDIRIHLALVECCRNQTVVEPVRELLRRTGGPAWTQVRRVAWADPQILATWVVQHSETYAALRDRCPIEAEQASRRHILSVVRNALRDGDLQGVDRVRLERLLEIFRKENSESSTT